MSYCQPHNSTDDAYALGKRHADSGHPFEPLCQSDNTHRIFYARGYLAGRPVTPEAQAIFAATRARAGMAGLGGDDDEPRCPKCGYSADDANLHGDHHLCSGRIPN